MINSGRRELGREDIKGGAPKGEKWGPKGWAAKGWASKNLALFIFVSRSHFLSFFPLLGVFSWNFGGV